LQQKFFYCFELRRWPDNNCWMTKHTVVRNMRHDKCHMKYFKLNAAFGKSLAKLRQTRGWTQEFLSFESNLTRNYISLLERGARSPTLDTIASLAAALKVSEVELIKMSLDELRKSIQDTNLDQ